MIRNRVQAALHALLLSTFCVTVAQAEPAITSVPPAANRTSAVIQKSAAARMVQVIQQAAHTGNPGDGLIVVTEAASVIRIRSGEQQEKAL